MFAMSQPYDPIGPSRAQIDALPGATVVEFGTGWCGHCRAARQPIDDALRGFSRVAHVMIEDGRGRPAGRSFAVKLWPTLIFLADGREVARVVRPTETGAVVRALALIAPPSRT